MCHRVGGIINFSLSIENIYLNCKLQQLRYGSKMVRSSTLHIRITLLPNTF